MSPRSTLNNCGSSSSFSDRSRLPIGLTQLAERAHTRTDLASLAVLDARSNGWLSQSARISLIGDHPNDVNAARANGLHSIAVATGLSSRGELSEAGPDILLDDLRSLSVQQVL